MSEFNVNSPQWNDMKQLIIIGKASINNNVVTFDTNEGVIRISLSNAGVRFQLGKARQHNYEMIKNEPQVIETELQSLDDQSIISAGDYKLIIEHSPFNFTLSKLDKVIQSTPKDGHFVRQYRLPPLTKIEDKWFMSFELGSSEPVYGLGEKWGKLDKRGQLIRSFNHDALGVNAEISYKNVPFAWSPSGWGLFVHTPAPVTHGVGFAPWSQRSYGLLVEDNYADIFLLHADSSADMLDLYTHITGKAPTPPDWSFGVILSKAYYKDVPELMSTAKAVREHNMPCDVITLDGRAWQDTDTRFAFEWDKSRYDNPAKVISDLKAMNFKVCIWEYPMISVENDLFDTLDKKGWLIKDKRTGKSFQYDWDMSAFGEVLTPLPKSGILDFTHPEAYEFWCESHKPLFDLGVDMIKADFGEQIEDDNMLAHNGESGQALHNIYTLLYNRCVYEAAQRYSKNGPFLFSRSAWIGSQNYPSQWGGDPQADWGGLAASIRGGLSWGLSGSPFYATDVGGFYKDTRDAELFVRWIQASVFSAHMRLHGIGQREPWAYGEEAEVCANQALKLRYKLLPYIQKTAQQATASGLPVQRAMVLAFPEDKAAWHFEDQYMFGDDLLVVPCLQPGGDVEFYLPEGEWKMMNDSQNRSFTGGKVHQLTLQLSEIAVFALVGKTIPLGAEIEHTDEVDSIATITDYWTV
ncbi:alpha-xylosidase [Pseudocolwellia sp. HL-MZ19]|uniref:glycoside hydrolase family 31 protein n=1 Tax=Pseudocolwellia sp. HL-MZ19 TaxID=3400846 RepID=UPI003CF118C2